MKDLFRTTVWRIIWCKGHIGFKLTCQQWTDLQLVCLWTPTGFTSSVLRSAGLCSIRKSAAHSRTSLVVVLITWSPASHVADGRDADHAVSTECRVTEQERKKQLVGICPNESVSFTPIRTSPLHHSLVCCSVSEQIQRKMGRRKNSWKWCDGHSKPASGGRLWLSFIQRWTSLNFSFSLVCRRSLMGLSDPPAAALSWNPAVFVLQTMSSKRSLWNDSTVSVCGRRQLLKRHCWRIFLLLIKQIPSFILLKFHHRDSAEARLQKLRSGFTCVLQKTLVTCSRFWMRSRSHQRWSIMQTWADERNTGSFLVSSAGACIIPFVHLMPQQQEHRNCGWLLQFSDQSVRSVRLQRVKGRTCHWRLQVQPHSNPPKPTPPDSGVHWSLILALWNEVSMWLKVK